MVEETWLDRYLASLDPEAEPYGYDSQAEDLTAEREPMIWRSLLGKSFSTDWTVVDHPKVAGLSVTLKLECHRAHPRAYTANKLELRGLSPDLPLEEDGGVVWAYIERSPRRACQLFLPDSEGAFVPAQQHDLDNKQLFRQVVESIIRQHQVRY